MLELVRRTRNSVGVRVVPRERGGGGAEQRSTLAHAQRKVFENAHLNVIEHGVETVAAMAKSGVPIAASPCPRTDQQEESDRMLIASGRRELGRDQRQL